jgi:hypothetical protein
MCDALAENGWPIQRVNNGSPASKPDAYANLAAETWFEARRMIERGAIILPNDNELVAQLTARRGWPDSKGRLRLEPKEDLRSRGLPSPDRADAVLAAMRPAYQAPLAVALQRESSGRETSLVGFCPRHSKGFAWDADHPFKPIGNARRSLL